MTNATQTLQEAMRASAATNATQVAITEESRLLLASVLEERMKKAVADGIKAAMSEEAAQKFATVFLNVMRAQASSSVDLWAGNAIRSMLKKAALFLFAGSLVYAIGGWGLVASAAKWLTAKVGG